MFVCSVPVIYFNSVGKMSLGFVIGEKFETEITSFSKRQTRTGGRRYKPPAKVWKDSHRMVLGNILEGREGVYTTVEFLMCFVKNTNMVTG